jgi:hypothetical protein
MIATRVLPGSPIVMQGQLENPARPASGEAVSSPGMSVHADVAPAAAARGILLIAYHFPPSAAVGGRRMANFASALRSLNWRVRALTIPDQAIQQIDRARLKSVAGIPVDVAPVWPTLVGLLTSGLALSRRRRPRGEHGPAVAPVRSGRTDTAAEPLRRRLRRYVMAFAFLPDGEKGWFVPAVIAAVRIIRRHRLPWFMTSCPPYTVHLVGLAVRALTGARWVADFRDPWMTTGSKRLYPTCAASLAIESWLERRVVERADLVVFNVERLRDAYRSRYARLPNEKFVYLPNAVPVNDDGRPAPEKFERYTICYTGSLYVGRSPEPIFRAVAQLIRAGAVAADSIRILLIGQCRSIDGVPTEAVARRHGVESNVELRDFVPYVEAVDAVRRSHLALLLAPHLPYQVPAKLYDYLGTGSRILAIAEDGATADLLKETQSGGAFSSGDVDGIAAFILDELGAPATSPPAASLRRYELTAITRDLVDHLSRAAHDRC